MSDGFSKFKKGIQLDPQSADPSNPAEGDQFYSDGTSRAKGMWQYKDGAWAEFGGAGGSGGINYLEGDNTNAETSVGDYVAYADAAGENPVDGTGGSPVTTISQVASATLRGTGHFQIAKSAANRQGEGASVDFTIDNADRAKKHTISFDKNTETGYADDDIRISVYDVTNSTLIRVNGEDVKAGNGTHYAQFQTASDSTSYRLIFHISSTSATSYNFNFDNVQVGPTNLAFGVNTKIQQASLTGASLLGTTRRFSTNTETGDTELLTYSDDGTNGTRLTANLDNVYVNVTYQEESDGSNVNSISNIRLNGVSLSNAWGYASATGIEFDNTTHIKLDQGDYIDFSVNSAARFVTSGNSRVEYIATRKNDAQISEDLGGREIQARLYRSSNQSITTATETKIQLDSVTFDTTASFDNVTNYDYTVPESGYYDILAQVNIANTVSSTVSANQRAFVTYKTNGASESTLGTKRLSGGFTGSWNFDLSGSDRRYLNKGDVLTFFVEHNFGSNVKVGSSSDDNTFVAITKLASPQTLLETATVAARYTTNAGLSIGATEVDVVYEDRVSDTHSAYNTSTGVYTIPVSGFYQINASAAKSNASSLSTTQNMNIDLKVNATDYARDIQFGNGSSTLISLRVSEVIYCEKGDEITVNVQCSISTNLQATDKYNTFSIARIK